LEYIKYCRAGNTEEALNALRKGGEKSVILAGGTDLMVEINGGRTSRDKHVVYIGEISELKNITFIENEIRIGCLATATQIAESNNLFKYAPALTMAAYNMASQQVRNRATIGGNIGTASPSGDLITALVAMDAEAVVIGDGEKRIKVKDITTGVKRTCLTPNQMIKEIIIPKSDHLTSSAFMKIGKRKAMTISIANAACQLSLAEDMDTILDLKVAIGACAETVVRAKELEEALIGRSIEDVKNASTLARQAISPITDQRATSWYRLEVVPSIVRRVIERSVEHIKGEIVDLEVIL
jgi:CO/xanthine dehydrogenase FAD-binding subunit